MNKCDWFLLQHFGKNEITAVHWSDNRARTKNDLLNFPSVNNVFVLSYIIGIYLSSTYFWPVYQGTSCKQYWSEKKTKTKQNPSVALKRYKSYLWVKIDWRLDLLYYRRLGHFVSHFIQLRSNRTGNTRTLMPTDIWIIITTPSETSSVRLLYVAAWGLSLAHSDSHFLLVCR